MKEYHLHMRPGASSGAPDPDLQATDDQCVVVNGKHFCAADVSLVGGASGFVIVGLGFSGVGAHIRLTPEGARRWATALNQSADEMEALNTQHAADQLAAALAKKGGDQ